MGKTESDIAVTKTHPIKSTLKAAIDYICNPEKTDGKLMATFYGCTAETADIEFAWIRRLQQESYEIKRGKYMSRRTSDQERFIRMKTPCVDYTEEAITVRLAGGLRPFRQPKQRDDRIRLLYNPQSKHGGLQHWAKLQNLKLAAKTFAWLEEHEIDNYAGLESKAAAVMEKRDTAHSFIKEI